MTTLSSSDEWSTPPELFAALSALYGPFDLDAAACSSNTKCPAWYERGADADALYPNRGWDTHRRVWLNPPYSRGNLDSFMGKARAEVLSSHIELVCCLVPGHTAEGWWHRHVEAPAGELLLTTSAPSLLGPRVQVCWEALTVETLRIRGRVRFVEASGVTGSARFPSAVVVFARPGGLAPLVVRRKRGPKPVVTPEIEAAVRAAVESGASIVQACELGGIARKTWYRHLERRGAA